MRLHEYTRVFMYIGLFIAPPKFMHYIHTIFLEAGFANSSKGFVDDLYRKVKHLNYVLRHISFSSKTSRTVYSHFHLEK